MLRIILVSLALVLAASAVCAQDGHGEPATDPHAATDVAPGGGEHTTPSEHGVIPSAQQALAPAIATFIVFGLVLIVLYTRVWPKITKGLDERAEKIRSEIASAEAARKQARDALEQYEKSLSEARGEAQKMLDDARAQQAKLSAELKAKADVELGQMRERAMRDIEAAKRSALNEIYAQTSALATGVASKILKREIGEKDNRDLVEQSLAELKSS